MKKLSLSLILIMIFSACYSQGGTLYQTGISAEQNLKAIGNLVPYCPGGMGFDTRYEGIKGSPRLFDTLLTSYLKVKGQDNYFQIEADIDLVSNILIFKHPKTGKLLSIPIDNITEVVMISKGKDLIFRTTEGKSFEKNLKEQKFFQVLKEGPLQFIKIPEKKFIEANYKGAYSADVRYDEYKTFFRYYLMSKDSSYHQIQLTRKSLAKLFPDRKDLINNSIDEKSNSGNEELVLSLLEKL